MHCLSLKILLHLTYECELLQHSWCLFNLQSYSLSVHVSVHPSVHPASHFCSVAPTVLAGSISYSYILSSNFRRCVRHVKLLAKFKTFNFCQFFKICNFDFVFFWLAIWCESLVWVIMGWLGVSQNAGVLVVLVTIKQLSCKFFVY